MRSNETLRSVCDDVELITGIKTVVYDESRRIIQSQPDGMCAFCREIRRSRELTAKCLACDEYGLSQSAKCGDICIYQCHMGLTEAIAPVTENGRTVGYLMLGQLLPENGRNRVLDRIEALGDDVDKAALRAHLDAMVETDEKHLRAAARILAMSASYVRFHEWMKQRKDTAAYKIETYVFENIANDSLTAQSVGAAVGFSRTALYNVCIKNFGMGMSEYIRRARADLAVRLLRTTSLPISLIAERVGVSSPSRLTRLLKSELGMTAKQVRSSDSDVEL